MKLTNEQADYLLSLPKKIVNNEDILNQIIIEQKFPLNLRFELISPSDNEVTFLWEINQSKKHGIRLSLHHQENDSKTGLFRVDFNSGHVNPEAISEFLPEKFHPFAGKIFTNNEHHIHYHVQGYKTLAWALPINETDFPIKEINDDSEFNTNFAELIEIFAKTINIVTKIKVEKLLL